jgi:hypothetical protein
MSKVQAALEATKQFLSQGNPDPSMLAIAKQLEAASRGEQHDYTMDRIIMYNFEPAPTPELQDWAELVLEAATEISGDYDLEDEDEE